jgi:hypothetical protein
MSVFKILIEGVLGKYSSKVAWPPSLQDSTSEMYVLKPGAAQVCCMAYTSFKGQGWACANAKLAV